jgi:hypothetical protein
VENNMSVTNQSNRRGNLPKAIALTCGTVAAILLMLPAGINLGSPATGEVDKKRDKPEAQADQVEIRLADHSVLRATFLDEQIGVQTRFGKLTVPASEVRRIEFGLRIPPEAAKKIETAIANLGSGDFKEREKASQELLTLKELGYAAVQKASKDADLEVAKRAKEILTKLREVVPTERLLRRETDVIYTDDFTIPGRIDASVFKVRQVYFGAMEVRLADLRGLRSLASGRTTEVVVDGTKYAGVQEAWLDTKILFTEGAPVGLTAEGEIDLYPLMGSLNSYIFGPAGPKRAPPDGIPAKDPPAGALLGRIGETGKVFIVGEKYEGMAPATGRLFLRIVGSPWSVACAGKYTVKVSGGSIEP